MADFSMSITNVFSPNTIIASAQMNTNLITDIRDKYNSMLNALNGHKHTGTLGDGPIVSAVPGIVEIGDVIAHYDFNGLVPIDTNFWAYCDGSVINNPDSPLNGQTLPDLSGRYIVGFGTDGGGDIDTAPWDTAPVGNAGHTVNIQHTHSINAHSHTVTSHNHTMGSHTHTNAAHSHSVNINSGGVPGGVDRFQIDEGGQTMDLGTGASSGQHIHNVSGNTGASSVTIDNTNLGNTGNSSPGTSAVALNTQNALSTTQSIQPRSIRMRWKMRIV